MDFGANKAPVAVIKKGAFGGTYFRDICSSVNGKWYGKWESLMSYKLLIKSFIAQIIMVIVLKNMVLNVEHR